jgi:hypothetical protein
VPPWISTVTLDQDRSCEPEQAVRATMGNAAAVLLW